MSRISIETVSNLNYMPLPSKSERVPYPILKKELTKIRFPVYEDHDDVANDKYASVEMCEVFTDFALNSQEDIRTAIQEAVSEKLSPLLNAVYKGDARIL